MMRKVRYIIVFVFSNFILKAQSLTDGIFMPKKYFCGGVMIARDRFDQYWEGTTLRRNANMGTMTMDNISIMANYGLSDKLNIIVMAPYIQTKASAGVMAGMNGIQDLTAGLKYNILTIKGLDIIAMAGGSIPLSNYVAAYPLAIGTQSKTLFGRAMLHYLNQKGWTMTAHSNYIFRNNITIDATNYYTDSNIFSNEVRMDNIFQAGLRAGYYTHRIGAELTFDQSNVLGGFDIRRNDMMFPANKQQMSRLGMVAFYRIKPLHDLQVIGNIAYTLSGRNVGKALSINLGLTMALDFNKKNTESKSQF
jgi:hypothetical protein